MKYLLVILSFCLVSVTMASSMIKFKDSVRSINKNGEDLQVTFNNHAAIYHLKSSQKNFSSLEKKLKESMKNKNEISLEIEALELIIVK